MSPFASPLDLPRKSCTSAEMPVIFERDNEALTVNPPPPAEQVLTVNGSNWLWAVTAIYIVSFLAFFALGFVARAGEKIFHYIFTIALLVGGIVYFAQASDLGWRLVPQVNELQNGGARQIFWPKYVGWVVSFPAVITAIGLLSGVSWATIFYNISLAWIWVISYLIAAFTGSVYKWGFFAFGTFAWILLAVHTFRDGHTGAKRVEVTRDYTALAGWVNLLWLLYPIAWGLSDGGNVIGITPSFIFFGILDVLLIPVTAFAFLFLSRSWDYGKLNIAFTQYGRVNTRAGNFPEKDAPPAAAGGTLER